MKNLELKEYSNAPDVDVSKIPKAVITDIANIIYAAMCRDAAAGKLDCTEKSA